MAQSRGMLPPAGMLPVLALALAVMAVVVLPPYPPLQDFIEWNWQAALMAGAALPEGVRYAPYPVPNSLFQLVLGGLALALPAALAGQVFLLGYAVAAVAVAVALGRRWRPEAGWSFAAILLVSFLFNTPFWNGYLNYQTGLLLFAAWFLVPARWRAMPGVILPAAVLMFLAHAMTFAAFGLLVGAEALAARDPRRGLALLPAAGLAAWYVLAKVPPPPAELMDAAPGWLALKLYTVAKLGPYQNFVFADGGDGVRWPLAYGAGVALNLAYAAGLGLLVGAAAWRRRTVPVVPLVVAGLLGLAFLALPHRIESVIVNPGERLLYPAMLLLLLHLPLPAWPVRVLGLGALVTVACLAGLGIGGRDWAVAVPPRAPQPPTAALFWHRPTAFACKWQAMQAPGAAPPGITFRTGLLIGAGGAECAADWRAGR